MNLLVLVISSNNTPVYAAHREVWRSYMKKTPGVDVYFLEMGDTVELKGDTLYCPGTESLRGLIYKTIHALKYFPVWRYDYVLRTNLSSLWNFPRLLQHIETFPRQMLYAGVQGHHDGIPFVSGAGILLTPDVCSTLLLLEKEVLDVDIIDDVDIGKVLTEVKIPKGSLPRTDILSQRDTYDSSGIHYRIKMDDGNRDVEPTIMRTLLKEW